MAEGTALAASHCGHSCLIPGFISVLAAITWWCQVTPLPWNGAPVGHGQLFTETKELLPAGPFCPEDLDATETLELPLSSWVHRGRLFLTAPTQALSAKHYLFPRFG